jgi:hypothetical protein
MKSCEHQVGQRASFGVVRVSLGTVQATRYGVRVTSRVKRRASRGERRPPAACRFAHVAHALPHEAIAGGTVSSV